MVSIHGDHELEQLSNSRLGSRAQFFIEQPHKRARRMWLRKPSIAWVFFMKALASLAFGIASGPYVEVFTDIVCREYYYERLPVLDVAAARYSSSSSGRCTDNPEVQAAVARAGAIFAIVAGVLSIFTVGWWGGFMDRHGRKRVLSIVVLASLFGDFAIILVFFYPHKVPWGYWFLATTAIVEGILGFPASELAAESAYVRDVSESHNLSANFTLLAGIFHAGRTIGPIIGGFLNEWTGSVITALYAATVLHLAYACTVWFALPESDSEASMIHARNQFAHELALAANVDASSFQRRVTVFTKALWDSFPLHVLTPRRLPHSPWKKDWNITLLAISAVLIMLTWGSTGDVFQYTLYTFGWSSLQLGYFISATGCSAAIFLMAILPAVVGVLKGPRTKPQRSEDVRRDMAFDLRLLRVSCLILAVGFVLVALAPTGVMFTLCYMITSFGQGFTPIVQGLAIMICAHTWGEDNTGRLLSAFGVGFGLGARLCGPLLYGTIFSNTVSFFPTAIFWTSVGCTLTASLLLAFIRLPNTLSIQDTEGQGDHGPIFRDDESANSELELIF